MFFCYRMAVMEKKEFYEKCAKLIGTDDLYVEVPKPAKRFNRETGEMYQPMTQATRWGGREPGNGRFPNHGLIRVFSDTIIHVSLKNPKLYGIFNSFEDVLKALEQAIERKESP